MILVIIFAFRVVFMYSFMGLYALSPFLDRFSVADVV